MLKVYEVIVKMTEAELAVAENVLRVYTVTAFAQIDLSQRFLLSVSSVAFTFAFPHIFKSIKQI